VQLPLGTPAGSGIIKPSAQPHKDLSRVHATVLQERFGVVPHLNSAPMRIHYEPAASNFPVLEELVAGWMRRLIVDDVNFGT
jgi:hypothetical protein